MESASPTSVPEVSFPALNGRSIGSSPAKKPAYAAVVSESVSNLTQFSPSVEVMDGVVKVSLPSKVLAEDVPLWSNYVVGFFIGDAPHIGKIHATVNRIWTAAEKSTNLLFCTSYM